MFLWMQVSSLLNLSNGVHVHTPLSSQVYKICWICLISSIKRKWGPSPCHCRAQHNEVHLHTLNLKHQWNSSDAFSSAHACTVWWITSRMIIQWILVLPATLHRACYFSFGWGNPAWLEVHWSQWRDSAPSTGTCWSKARTGNSEEM